MKLDCPHCGKSLKGRLLRTKPAPGERRFLPLRSIPYCSHCCGTLFLNIHPKEKMQVVWLALPVIPFELFLKEPQKKLPLLLIACSIAAMLAGLAYINFKYLRNWQRYASHEQFVR